MFQSIGLRQHIAYSPHNEEGIIYCLQRKLLINRIYSVKVNKLTQEVK